jgi:hypothetical protein
MMHHAWRLGLKIGRAGRSKDIPLDVIDAILASAPEESR